MYVCFDVYIMQISKIMETEDYKLKTINHMYRKDCYKRHTLWTFDW